MSLGLTRAKLLRNLVLDVLGDAVLGAHLLQGLRAGAHVALLDARQTGDGAGTCLLFFSLALHLFLF